MEAGGSLQRRQDVVATSVSEGERCARSPENTQSHSEAVPLGPAVPNLAHVAFLTPGSVGIIHHFFPDEEAQG